MRQRNQNPEPEKSKPARMEPLAEGIDGTSQGRRWSRMGNDGLVSFARRFIAERGIRGRTELKRENSALYWALIKQKKKNPAIMDEIGLGKKRKCRDWDSMSDGDFIRNVQEFLKENGIGCRRELAIKDTGMYQALLRREKRDPGLRQMVGLENRYKNPDSMDDKEIAGYSREFMIREGINARVELARENSSLYQALLRRERENPGFMGRIGFERLRQEKRGWGLMNDEELLAHTRHFIEKRGISIRSELAREDAGLYFVLRKRHLLARVFAKIESLKHADAVDGVIEAIGTFND